MSRLTSINLENVLSSDRLELLAQNKIVTSLQFLQTSSEKLSTMLNLNIKQVLEVKKKILSVYGAKCYRGHKLHHKALKTKTSWETGIAEVDKWTGGGFLSGNIVEIYGEPGCGKSLLTLQLLAKSSLVSQKRLLYLSTSAFNSEVLLSFLQKITTSEEEIAESLKKISYCYVNDIQKLFDVLSGPDVKDYSVIVVDSLAILILPLFAGRSNLGISLLAKMGSLLKKLAKINQSLIVVINHVSSWGKRQFPPNPSLGRNWLHVPTLRFLLERKGQNLYHLTTQKNAHGPSGTSCDFQLNPV